MKYIVILGDGMADEPIDALGGKSPLACAETPVMDELASKGEMGMVQNVPAGMAPGSDVANLSVLGYDPAVCYSGRSPLEALSVGVAMEPTDIVLRCNIVTLTEEEPYAKKTILDHSSGEISTADADILMDAIRENFNSDEFQYYTGTSYRHITIWKNGTMPQLEPPHDHLTHVIGPYLPKEPKLRAMMEKSFDILNTHPLNLERAAKGKNKANSLWFWGAGTKPSLQNFTEKTGLKGAMVSAVDLLKGIAVGAGMKVYQVPGATGSIDTNFEGKAQAAIDALTKDGCDFVYVHVEAPDEMGHQGSYERKVKAIENLDKRIIKRVVEKMEAAGEDFRMLVLPDHPTPVAIRTHVSDPVPYMLYDSTDKKNNTWSYNEKDGEASGNYIAEGHTIINRLFEK